MNQTIESCNVCLEYQYSFLMQHKLPPRSWSVIGVDLFECNGKLFPFTGDYYCIYPIVKTLQNSAPNSQILILMKEVFAEYRIADNFMQDIHVYWCHQDSVECTAKYMYVSEESYLAPLDICSTPCDGKVDLQHGNMCRRTCTRLPTSETCANVLMHFQPRWRT